MTVVEAAHYLETIQFILGTIWNSQFGGFWAIVSHPTVNNNFNIFLCCKCSYAYLADRLMDISIVTILFPIV